MKIKDIKAGWLFQYVNRENDCATESYGIRAHDANKEGRETYFNLSGKAYSTAGKGNGYLQQEAVPICHITDLTKHLPDYFKEGTA